MHPLLLPLLLLLLLPPPHLCLQELHHILYDPFATFLIHRIPKIAKYFPKTVIDGISGLTPTTISEKRRRRRRGGT